MQIDCSASHENEEKVLVAITATINLPYFLTHKLTDAEGSWNFQHPDYT